MPNCILSNLYGTSPVLMPKQVIYDVECGRISKPLKNKFIQVLA